MKNVTEGMHLIGVTTRRLSPFDLSNTDVNVIRDLMIHDLDLPVDLVGSSIEGLSTWGRSISTAGIDHAVANLSFRDGPVVTLFASRVTEQKVGTVEVIAEGAYVEADLLSKSVLVYRRTFPQYLNNDNTTKYRQESLIERIHVPMFEPLMLELRHLVDCVRQNRPSRVPGSDGQGLRRMLSLSISAAGRCDWRRWSGYSPGVSRVSALADSEEPRRRRLPAAVVAVLLHLILVVALDQVECGVAAGLHGSTKKVRASIG